MGIKLTIVERDGSERQVEGEAGISVMETIRGAGIDELVAMCGGCCACATCHVFVQSEFMDRLPPIGEDEEDLLGASDCRSDLSRLSCQIPLGEALSGMKVTIAPED